MLAGLLDLHVLSGLSRDGRLLFATRMLRMFGYGLVAFVLLLYLTAAWGLAYRRRRGCSH